MLSNSSPSFNLQSSIFNRQLLPRWLWAYDVALALAGALWLPYYLFVRRPGHPGMAERFGAYPASVRQGLAQGERPVWVHAVSVGEVLAALPLLAALKARIPRQRWVVSTTTPTGQRLARERLPIEDTVVYAPWDLTPCVRRALAAIRPRVFIGLETELWPNLLLRLGAAGIPTAIVNGRISARSFPRYRRIHGWLRPALMQVQVWAMQTQVDAQRIVALGVDPSRVHVVGNLKADASPPEQDLARLPALRAQFGLNGQTPLWIAGSTHLGEETILLKAFRQVRTGQPALRLMLAPRHPERVREVERLVRKAGFLPVRRSKLAGADWTQETVVIVDTLGELAQLYALADFVFVGGSLVPRGGHNLLEPAQWAKPILTGPSLQNFQSIAELLRQAEGLQIVESAEDLAAHLMHWLAHPEIRERLGERAQGAIAAQAGSTRKTVELLCQALGPVLGK